MNENNIDFMQVRLWNDCINNCTFCSLQNKCKKTPIESKKLRLQKTMELIKTLEVSHIGLMGGDFFEGQLHGCEEEWSNLMYTLLETGLQIIISANLIHEQYFLKETIEALQGNLLISTSYDEVGRFHTERARQNWLTNIKMLHKFGCEVFCTCIPTQELFESKAKFPKWLGINLCDPHLGIDWYIDVDKNHYHEHLISENTLFNLPQRQTAIRWLRKHPSVTKNYASYAQTHSNTIFAFDEKDQIIKESDERLISNAYLNPKCGHPYFSQCYADSEECMMCDAKKILLSI